jgi:uncharacterized membrane protein
MATGTAKIGLPTTTLSDFPRRAGNGDRAFDDRERRHAMNPLGDNLLAWLVLAFGGAMCIGTLLALVRPPEPPAKGAKAPARQVPLARSIVFIAVGGVAALWALASLLSS